MALWSRPRFVRLGTRVYRVEGVLTAVTAALILGGLLYVAVTRVYPDPLVPAECLAGYERARSAADTALVDARHIIRRDPNYRTCGELRLLRAMRDTGAP